jgi:hypothetical protein
MIRWRALLDHCNVAWLDRGRNLSRGWLAIKCPWCGPADPSAHLGINEESGIYHCLRNNAHRGKSPYYLLAALGVPRRTIDDVLVAYSSGLPVRPAPPVEIPRSRFAQRWASFAPAAHDARALEYLRARHFWHPRRTAETFDLRVGRGNYAARLWFPLLAGEDEVVGFTGRAMTDIQPRYYTETATHVLYIPRAPRPNDRIIILVEGPFDALRLADATIDRYDVFVAALCGAALTETKKRQVRWLSDTIPRLFLVLDRILSDATKTPTEINDAQITAVDANRLVKELHISTGQRTELPEGIKDPGEMTNHDIYQWLNRLLA